MSYSNVHVAVMILNIFQDEQMNGNLTGLLYVEQFVIYRTYIFIILKQLF